MAPVATATRTTAAPARTRSVTTTTGTRARRSQAHTAPEQTSAETSENAKVKAELKTALDALLDEIVNGSDEQLVGYLTRLAHERARAHRAGATTHSLEIQARQRGVELVGIVTGKSVFEKLGRKVRDGEKPFKIFGPGVRRVIPVNQPAQPATPGQQTNQPQQQQGNTPQQQPAAGQARVVTHFFLVDVYDWSQTESTDPDYVEPNWAVPLAHGDLSTLRTLTKSSPVPVEFVHVPAKVENGWLDADGIHIDSSALVGNQIYTLLHELAHHYLGHLDRVASTKASTVDADGFTVREVCEQEAALTQFLAMKMLGLDETVGNEVTKAAAGYLRTWTKTDKSGATVAVEGRKAKRKILTSRFDVAAKAADQIVKAYLDCQQSDQTTGA